MTSRGTMPRNLFDYEPTVSAGVACTRVPAGDDDLALPPPPSAFDLTPVDPLPAPTADDLDGLEPRAAEEAWGERVVPGREVSARPVPVPSDPADTVPAIPSAIHRAPRRQPSRIEVGVLAVLVVGLAAMAGTVRWLPAAKADAPHFVSVGPAEIACLADDALEPVRPAVLLAHACRWGGELKCTATTGCWVYRWHGKEVLRGWERIGAGRVVPIESRLYVNVVACLEASAELEPTP